MHDFLFPHDFEIKEWEQFYYGGSKQLFNRTNPIEHYLVVQ
mgnify:FL=1